MGFLRRNQLEGSGALPDWADVFSPGDYRRFRRVITKWLETYGRPYREIGAGGIEMEIGNMGKVVVGLANVAQKCHMVPAADWPAVVDEHFDALAGNVAMTSEPEFADVSTILKIRIYPGDFGPMPPGDSSLVHQTLVSGAIAALVLDHPKTIVTLPLKTAERWGVDRARLFETALANVRRDDRPAVERKEVGRGAKLSVLYGESFFTATWLMMLDDFIVPATPHGAIVAVPNRHIVLFQPIVDLSVVTGIQTIIPVASDMHRDGPGSISPNVYWRRGNCLTPLPITTTARGLVFAPPDDLIEVFNQLPEPA
jgi:hypothetical protein